MASCSFDSKEEVKEVEVKEDVLLAGHFNEKGENLVLNAGKYKVENGKIEFFPTVYNARKYCWIKHMKGHILGYEVDYTINVCVSFGNDSRKGFISLTPKLDSNQLDQILKSSDRSIELNESIIIDEDGIKYTIKPGKYILNDDGSAYLQNVVLN